MRTNNKMKLLLSTLTILFFTALVATPGEEAVYEGYEVSYQVERGSGEVYLNINLDPSKYSEIKVERSDNPVQYFRQIKAYGSWNLDQLTGSDVIVDKYPLSAKSESYYKVVTIDKSGVQKSYPSVKL